MAPGVTPAETYRPRGRCRPWWSVVVQLDTGCWTHQAHRLLRTACIITRWMAAPTLKPAWRFTSHTTTGRFGPSACIPLAAPDANAFRSRKKKLAPLNREKRSRIRMRLYAARLYDAAGGADLRCGVTFGVA